MQKLGFQAYDFNNSTEGSGLLIAVQLDLHNLHIFHLCRCAWKLRNFVSI
jgi:hypothetical protein